MPLGSGNVLEDQQPRFIHVFHDGGDQLPMDDNAEEVPWL